MSTNIAETSVTIDGVVYVVDCGLAKRRVFRSKTGVDSLLTTFISRSEVRCVAQLISIVLFNTFLTIQKWQIFISPGVE